MSQEGESKMKKLLLVVAALMALAMPVKAEDNNVLSRTWTDLQSNSSFHLFDNGTSAYFYDFKQHESMAGVSTEFYQYRHATLDLGLVKSIENGDHAFPILNANLHVGSYLANVPAVVAGLNVLGLNSGILQYFTAGAWAGRDFSTSEYRYGVSSGLRVEFK